ncbi:FecCD family ABC transporter permease [Sporosarcina limicola]|uniref:Iron complex transport system permease protein n=1 Tax=Sporosarcina limicola TaxID=34101 RepID=A0A927RDE3_9BACL|nr:iron ABC transporter permease [Sporosarcina limicola]MBE1555255.1 iron complex transport system permease protein [Sporosarcina limicola]
MKAAGVKEHKNAHPFAKKRTVVLVALSILLVLSCTVSLMIGPVSFSFNEIWSGLFYSDESLERRIVWELRFPRVLIGLIVGMCLATSGAILQGVMKNPLADPGIIGVSSGAGLAATVIMIIFPAYILFLPLAAFLGALITALVIYTLSWKGGTSPIRIILVGVAINAIIGSFMSALMLLYSDRVQSVLPWLAGGIAGVGWVQFEMIIYYAIAALVFALFSIKHIRILRLGDEVAKLLGHNVEKSRFFLIILSTLLAGIAVSVSGLIGFVGLVVPHILRIMIGGDYRYLLPASALGGGLLVVLADTVARSAFNPIELPVGILLAFFGGPFFLYMIQRRRDSFASN